MRAHASAGRDDDRFEGRVHVPAGEFAYQRPALHLSNFDRSFIVFLDITEVRNLISTLTENVESVQAADDQWAAKRAQDMADAARDGFLDNADPDMDTPGADDHLADVQP